MDEENKKNVEESPEVVNPEVVEPTKEEVKKPKSKVRKIGLLRRK